jgi:potassium/hydrogen antiporter
METSTAIASNQLLLLLGVILISGVFFSKLSEVIHLPDVVLFIVGGVIVGPQVLNIVSLAHYPVGNQFILTLGAAYILYDGGREIHIKVLNKVKISVTLLSTLGVLISAFITGYFAMLVFHLNFTYSLLLGSVIASTDPSVLVPLFKNMKIKNKLKQTIISESAFNDAAGAIMTFAVAGIILSGKFSLAQSLFELLKTSIGGIAIGSIIGIAVSVLKSDWTYGIFRKYPSVIALISVIGAYVISSYIGVSGFMAVFVVGIVCGNKHMLGLHLHEEYIIAHDKFKEVFIMILRVMIFTILGTQVDFGLLAKNWTGALIVVLTLIFIARPISVFFSIILDKRAEWNLKEMLYLMWIRETGVIPAALAGMLISMKIAHSDIISSVTTMAIIITLTFQASTSKYFAKYLKLDTDQDHEV